MTWPRLCCVTDDEMTWKSRDGEIWRNKEKRKKENKAKIGDTEGEAETIRRMLSLHHYFNTHSPSTDSSSFSFSFFIRAPSHLFFLLFILSLPVSIIRFYHSCFSRFLLFRHSDKWAMKYSPSRHRKSCMWMFLCVCGWQALHAHACMCVYLFLCVCVCVYSFWLWLWSLSGPLAALEGSPPVFDSTFVFQKIIWQAQNQIGC